MLTTIELEFSFEAAHRLDRFPEGHKCKRLHGHSYRVWVALRGEPGRRTGIVVDYYDVVTAYNEAVQAKLDHRFLNEVPGLEVSTTELLAAWIYDALQNYSATIRDDENKMVCKSLGGYPMQIVGFAPRSITVDGREVALPAKEILECGHHVNVREDFIGPVPANIGQRRRCKLCPTEHKSRPPDPPGAP